MTITTAPAYRPGNALRLGKTGATELHPALIGPFKDGYAPVIYLSDGHETTAPSDSISTAAESAAIRASRTDLDPADAEREAARPAKVAVLYVNTYSDGHASRRVVELDAPDAADDIEAWWEVDVLSETGDGHGADRDVSAHYEATVLYAPDAALVGQSREWA